MDKLTHYGTLIKRHLSDLVELIKRQPTPGVETLCVFDEERHQYLLLRTGWSQDQRVHSAHPLRRRLLWRDYR